MLGRVLEAFGFEDEGSGGAFFFDPRPDAHGLVHAEWNAVLCYRACGPGGGWSEGTARASGNMHKSIRVMVTYAIKRISGWTSGGDRCT